MGLWHPYTPQLTRDVGCADAQLGLKVFPLVEQLAVRFCNLAKESWAQNFASVEVVASSLRLVCKADEERGDCGRRIGLGLEAGKLRMKTVPWLRRK